MRLTRIWLAGLGVLLAACHDTSGPGFNGAVYELRTIDGEALPAPYGENLQYPNRMFADTLVLRADGSGEWRIVVEDSPGGAKRHAVDAFHYTGQSHIEITFVCPPLALCIAPPHLTGDVTETGIVFSMSRVTRAPLVFDRIKL